MQENKVYAAIDLKSFYASVECVERGLDPLATNLVVADKSRTEKTICLAVTPSLKRYGIPGRARLFEVVQKVKEVNVERKIWAKGHVFEGKSSDANELDSNPNLQLDYIIAKPRMAYYMKYSTDIYNIYLKYFSPDDIYVYSVDEVFIDMTHYLKTYKLSAKDLVTKVIQDVYNTTGITATGGIGTNMYLCKIAMDIGAKHVKADKNGVRICELNIESYRKMLWTHRPLTDFWRVGKGTAKRLEAHGMYCMGDVARMSIKNEDLLFKLLGITAEFLIEHAWGYEDTEIKDIKSYKPKTTCLTEGQVLHCAYNYDKIKIIVKEMAENMSLSLAKKGFVTDQIVLTIGYDIDNLIDAEIKKKYKGDITVDRYGREVPKHAHGTINFDFKTNSTKLIVSKTMELFERIINKNLLCRRVHIFANKLADEKEYNNKENENRFEQLDLFSTPKQKEEEKKKLEEERKSKFEKDKKELQEKIKKESIILKRTLFFQKLKYTLNTNISNIKKNIFLPSLEQNLNHLNQKTENFEKEIEKMNLEEFYDKVENYFKA